MISAQIQSVSDPCKFKTSKCTHTSKFNLQWCFTKSKLLFALALIFLDYCQAGWANKNLRANSLWGLRVVSSKQTCAYIRQRLASRDALPTKSKLLLVLVLIFLDYCQTGRANSFSTRISLYNRRKTYTLRPACGDFWAVELWVVSVLIFWGAVIFWVISWAIV